MSAEGEPPGPSPAPRPDDPGGVPSSSRYARAPREPDLDAGEVPASPPDPGRAALDELCAYLTLLLGVAPIAVTLSSLAGSLRGAAPSSGQVVLALAALTPLVALLSGLGERRPWSRRAALVLVPGAAVGGTIAGLVTSHGAAAWVPIAFAWLLAAHVIRRLMRADVRALFARPEPPRPGEGLWGCWAVLVALCLGTVALTWLQRDLRSQTTGTVVGGRLGALLTIAGAFGGSLVVVIGAWLALSWRDQARRDPARTPPATRARILVLRGEGRSLRQIAHALDEERRAPPGGGRWTGRALRGALRLEPRAPGSRRRRDLSGGA